METTATREDVRRDLRVFMNRTGLDLRTIAGQTGFAHRSLLQFSSAGDYGAGEGAYTAAALRKFMDAHPWQPPELPGQLYSTAATRAMDDLIDYCAEGNLSVLYGPAGSQKSFLLEFRAAEAAREPEPRLIWIPVPGRMTPLQILKRISIGLGAPYAQGVDGVRQNILYTVRARKSPVAVALDECDLMERDLDTLETIRRLADLLRGKLGLIVAGNDQIMNLFKPRRGRYFEQWRSRVEQKTVRVLGPTRDEARHMLIAEVGDGTDEQVNGTLDDCTVIDPLTRKKYISARRLFLAIRDILKRRARRKAS